MIHSYSGGYTMKTSGKTAEMHFKSNRKAAVITGLSLLLMAIAAGIAYGYLHRQIVLPNDAEATAQSVLLHNTKFLIEIVLWWIIFLLDVTVSLSLFFFYKETNPALSGTAMGFRLLYALILGAAVSMLMTAPGAGKNALEHIVLFEKVWSAALIPFGLHLILLGVLAVKSEFTPRLLSLLIIFSGGCYVLLHSFSLSESTLLMHLSSAAEPILSIPMALAEILLAVWMLIGAVPRRKNHAAAV